MPLILDSMSLRTAAGTCLRASAAASVPEVLTVLIGPGKLATSLEGRCIRHGYPAVILMPPSASCLGIDVPQLDPQADEELIRTLNAAFAAGGADDVAAKAAFRKVVRRQACVLYPTLDHVWCERLDKHADTIFGGMHATQAHSCFVQ